MHASLDSLFDQYGTLLVFVNVLLVQLGLPIPAVPGLIIAGGLIATGQLDPVLVIAAAVLASTLADYGWYLAGRRLGYAVLVNLCRLSLSPDRCARQARIKYERWGASLLLFGKFVPGAALLAPPLAGILHMPCHRFLMYAGMGGLLWSGSFITLGYALDVRADRVVSAFTSAGAYAIPAAAAVLASYLLLRLARHRHVLRLLDATSISAEQAQLLLAAPTGALLIDVRSALARELDGRQLPGALVVDADRLDRVVGAVPRETQLLIFCACPNEAASASATRRLRHLGYLRVSPLKDGIDGWAGAGFPVLSLDSGAAHPGSFPSARAGSADPFRRPCPGP